MKVAIEKELNLNKSNWKTVKFGDVVTEPKESTRDIVGDGFQHIVGLEHIDTENIHLKRWMEVGGETTFSKVFRKGDVLFGRRRAYLKKAALANFEGVCSGDITVFRTKSNLIPELLPFIVNNERFFDYAIKHSAGGLSPRVKFKDLANFEFLLPPKEEQKKLAELLWTMDDVVEKEKMTLEKLNIQKVVFIQNFLIKYKTGKRIFLGDICRPRQWPTISSDEISDKGYLVYGANGIIGRYHSYNHKEQVIAICCRGANCGSIHLTEPESYVTGNAMCLDNLDEKRFLTKFLYYVLRNSSFKGVITGSAQPQIVREDLDKFKIYGIEMSEQEKLIKSMNQFDRSSFVLSEKIESSQSLKKSLINQIF